MFGKLKQQRRIATRYDKSALSFESFLNLAAVLAVPHFAQRSARPLRRTCAPRATAAQVYRRAEGSPARPARTRCSDRATGEAPARRRLILRALRRARASSPHNNPTFVTSAKHL